jgi:hypothetical protein
VALLLLTIDPALAWTDATRVRMIRDALKVTPPALATILKRYQRDLEAGMLDPSRHEDEEIHYQHADGGKGLAATGVVQKARELAGLLQNARSPRRFAYGMGSLAHLLSDVEFPLNASDADPREPLYREAYRVYVEKSLGKVPFVLDQRGPADLDGTGDLRGFVLAAARRAGAGYAMIGPAFNDDGTPRTPAALDDRSMPFGVASVAYSHAASDIARVWRYLWGSMHGDLQGTPFLQELPAGKPKEKP